MCAERGHLDVAKELLEHKAYVNAKSKVNPQSLSITYALFTRQLSFADSVNGITSWVAILEVLSSEMLSLKQSI